jgi:hypothetical protein
MAYSKSKAAKRRRKEKQAFDKKLSLRKLIEVEDYRREGRVSLGDILRSEMKDANL